MKEEALTRFESIVGVSIFLVGVLAHFAAHLGLVEPFCWCFK